MIVMCNGIVMIEHDERIPGNGILVATIEITER